LHDSAELARFVGPHSRRELTGAIRRALDPSTVMVEDEWGVYEYTHAFLWDNAGGAVDLQNQLLPGSDASLFYAEAINEGGAIVVYGYNGSGGYYSDSFGQISDGNRPTYSYGAQLTVPLGNLGPRNQYKASKATLQQVVLQLKQIEQGVMVQIDNAVKQAQSAYESVDATRLARVYAEAALDAEQKKYAVGKSTTFTVLQLQTALTTARSQEIRSLANYNEALANLAAQEGSTLERNNIFVETK
jgi:hypothetical protein